MNRPLVTIGIPTVTRLEYLREAVESAQAQTYPNIEIAVAQDPLDETLDDAIAKWTAHQASLDQRIAHWVNSHTLGLAGNWNEIATRAKGDYITIIGDDDRLLPKFVEELVRAAEAHRADVAFCGHWVINKEGRRLTTETELFRRRFARHKILPGLLDNPTHAVWRNSIPMSASLLRTSYVKQLRFKDDLNTPDIEFHTRLSSGGGRYAFVDMLLAEYRVHASSETSAGLRHDRLVEYLTGIPVPSDCEAIKRNFMRRIVLEATKQVLKRGDVLRARELLRNEYYPGLSSGHITGPDIELSLRGLALAFLAYLPWRLGIAILSSNSKSIVRDTQAPRRP